MATTMIVLTILGLGAAALLGRTPDSRDPEYALGRLIGRPPLPPEPADEVQAAEAVVLTVPAAWLAVPQAVTR
jgi:hypothetical protein